MGKTIQKKSLNMPSDGHNEIDYLIKYFNLLLN